MNPHNVIIIFHNAKHTIRDFDENFLREVQPKIPIKVHQIRMIHN